MRKQLLLIFLFFFSCFVFIASGAVESSDGLQYLTVARNWYYKGEPVLFTNPEDEYRDLDGGKNVHMNYIEGKNNKFYSTTGLGFTLAFLPSVIITDLIYKLNNIKPVLEHFPLQSDWLILLLGSFTNAFFGAILGLVLYLYLLYLHLTKKQALLMSIIGIFATNLLVYTKHSFAQMMFASFLLLSFYLVKGYSENKNKLYLFFSGLSYGIVIISYNQTFLLPFPVLLIYYLLVVKKKHYQDIFIFILGLLPFLGLYSWYENLKQSSFVSPARVVLNYGKVYLGHFPKAVFFEGIYGQLFSSGRSFFLYSPLLLLPFVFWHKLKKQILPELMAFILLLIIDICFYARQIEVLFGYNSLWHGEFSWGPRYLVPIIPFGVLIIGWIVVRLKFLQRIIFVLPLIITGLYISLLGVLIPYQLKFSELGNDIFVSGTRFQTFVYGNFLPRYSPIFMANAKLKEILKLLPKTLNNGDYNVRFVSGINLAFHANLNNDKVVPRRRKIIKRGFVLFDSNLKHPVKAIRVIFDYEQNSSATASILLNNHQIKANSKIDPKILRSKDNLLIINGKNIYITKFFINNDEVNLESIDVSFVSPLISSDIKNKYLIYRINKINIWEPWYIRSDVYNRTLDLWWLKTLYFWDIKR